MSNNKLRKMSEEELEIEASQAPFPGPYYQMVLIEMNRRQTLPTLRIAQITLAVAVMSLGATVLTIATS